MTKKPQTYLYMQLKLILTHAKFTPEACHMCQYISTAEDTSSLSGFLQILQEKQKTDYFYKYRTGLNNFGI